MGARDLARQDQLDSGVERPDRFQLVGRQARVQEIEDTPLGLGGGDELAGAHYLRSNVPPSPEIRDAARLRLRGQRIFEHVPERAQLQLREVRVERLALRAELRGDLAGSTPCRRQLLRRRLGGHARAASSRVLEGARSRAKAGITSAANRRRLRSVISYGMLPQSIER